MSGIGCGGALGVEACERWDSRALQGAGHGDGEVAAAELVGVAWRGKERSSAKGSGSRRSLGCRVGRWGSRSWPAALLCGGRRRSGPARRESMEGERWKMKGGPSCKF